MKRLQTAATALLGLFAAVAAVAILSAPKATAKGKTSSSTTTIHDDGSFYSYSSDRDFSYAVIKGHSESSIAVSDMEYIDEISDLQEEADRNDGGVFWFRLDGRNYIVRDRALVEEAQRIVQPMIEAGREQGKHGAKMGEYGARMGAIGALQGRMGALRAQLAMHRWADSDDRADVEKLERELDEISDEMRDLRAEQKALGKEQGRLGKEQAKLGRKQSAASKQARTELRALAKRALDAGKAERPR